VQGLCLRKSTGRIDSDRALGEAVGRYGEEPETAHQQKDNVKKQHRAPTFLWQPPRTKRVGQTNYTTGQDGKTGSPTNHNGRGGG